jgi:cytidyltransferase-like protein
VASSKVLTLDIIPSQAYAISVHTFCYDKTMVVQFDDLFSIREKLSKQEIVLTSGTFDLFHVGHLNYLQKVKVYGDVVIVMLSGDARVRARKGLKRPIIKEGDRAQILDGLEIVDYVFLDPSKLGPGETDPIHAEVL